jgi:hypothetical protein
VITPQDGSEDFLVEPYYWLDIRDAEGRRARQAERFCGNTYARYDERTVLEIGPGATTRTAVGVGALRPGRYTARLHYIVENRPTRREIRSPEWSSMEHPFLEGPPPLPPHPDEIFVGWARSEPVTFEVPAR